MKCRLCVSVVFFQILFFSVAVAQELVKAIDSRQAFSLQQEGKVTLVDIRTEREWDDTGVPPGAVLLTIRTEADFVQSVLRWSQGQKDRPLALICRTGNRTAIAAQALVKAGFTQVMDVREGIVGGRNGPGWQARQLPLVPKPD